MKLHGLALMAITWLAPAVGAYASGQQESERTPDLKCEVGPLNRSYGETDWLIYACDDSRSIVVVSDKGNPALPFFFILYVKPDGTMTLYGEGDGDKATTAAAFEDLKRLTREDVMALVREARDVR